jgi:hypothetical protein
MPETDNNEIWEVHQEGWEAVSPWLGWFCGPAAWALHQGIGYAMVPLLCRMGTRWPYHALTAVAIALCAAGISTALSARRRSRRVYPPHSADRLHMMALVGLMLSAGALGGIALEYAGSFWLSTCTGVDG